jgi:large subunit ribosomal protein L9
MLKEALLEIILYQKKKALFASPQNIKEVEKIKQDLSKKDEERKKEAKVINEKIKNKQYEIKKLSTENKELYGSIKPTEISKILEEKEQVKVNPSLIQPSKEIKSLGDFDVLINLHPEVQTQIVIKAVAQEEAK